MLYDALVLKHLFTSYPPYSCVLPISEVSVDRLNNTLSLNENIGDIVENIVSLFLINGGQCKLNNN